MKKMRLVGSVLAAKVKIKAECAETEFHAECTLPENKSPQGFGNLGGC